MINKNKQVSTPPYRHNAFTLAEVLITLVIIGVIAAITIPTMMNSKNNEELRAGLLKAQSTLAGALEMYYAKNGERITPSTLGSHELKTKILPYISTAKDCGLSSCVSSTNASEIYKTLNNESLNAYYIDDGQFIMNDSMFVFIENSGANNGNLVFMAVDVNGFKKKPNKAGHDLFMFELNSKGNLIPMGTRGSYMSDQTTYCSMTSSHKLNGLGCTAKALADPNYFKNLH
ncbi:prepilin-type N-terminal cleavage/methylation domain-containing protein [bacterium]|nr:prepilin-type N-terminal cleavage/methylation domain-containing protein [bacterium]